MAERSPWPRWPSPWAHTETNIVSRPDVPLDHITPYDRCSWSDTVVERLLFTGEHARELIGYFGNDEYYELVKLARQAQLVPLTPDAPHVYIVPGIMGSQLGRVRPAPSPCDVLWLDPIDISVGHLAQLRLPSRGDVISLGI